MRSLFVFFAFISLIISNSTTHADIFSDAQNRAVQAQQLIVDDFSQLRMSEHTRGAINLLVNAGIQSLKDKGYNAEAQRLQQEWSNTYSMTSDGFEIYDLGDHKPLMQWLGDFYNKIHGILGDQVMNMTHLDDIHVINYGIPVVFRPWGDKQSNDLWDQEEYRKHFVPLIGVVTFWSTWGACAYVSATHFPPVGKWCFLISLVLKNGTKSLIAPSLSNFVYDKLSGQTSASAVKSYSVENLQIEQEASLVPHP